MLRTHTLLMLLFAQVVFAERLVLRVATGGRGVIGVINLFLPWAVLVLVVIPFRHDLRRALWTREFLTFWMPFLALFIALPFLGVAVGGFPVRSAYTAWNGILFCTFLAVGAVGSQHVYHRRRVMRAYFLLAVLAQFGMATVQTMGQFQSLPGFLKPLYDWDFNFKLTYISQNVILGRATGFYLNPNSLGIWALLAAWISFFLLKGKSRVLGVVASFATILLCQSRGTLAGFLVSVAVYAVIWMIRHATRVQRLKATLLVALLAIPLLAVGVFGLPPAMEREVRTVPVVGPAVERYLSGARVLSEGADADANFKGRTIFWKAAFRYLADHPLGSLGSPEMVILVPPDNQFIAALEQGSFYFLFALLLTYLGAFRLLGSTDRTARLLAVASVGMLINGVSAVPFAYPAAFLYWLLVGAHMGRQAYERLEPETEEEAVMFQEEDEEEEELPEDEEDEDEEELDDEPYFPPGMGPPQPRLAR